MDNHQQISKEKVYDFLSSIPLAVFGTVSENNIPHLVTMYYVVDRELNFYFVTKSQTAKVTNIERSANVSVVMSDKDSYKTVEANGVAVRLSGYEKIRTIITLFTSVFQKVIVNKNNNLLINWPPPIKKIEAGEIIVYAMQPNHLRFTDYSQATPLDGYYSQEIIAR